ncbi:hypothetical protein EMIT0P176_400006 [Pseudomonas sp. IT-P176]
MTAGATGKQPRLTDLAQPLAGGIIAHMAGVAQHFDALQVSVEQRATRRQDINERRHPARLQNPPHFAQGQAEIAPMVRRIPAEDEVEFSIGERQPLGGAQDCRYVAQATLNRSTGDHIEHLLRQVVGHHFLDQRRHMKTHMPGAAAQVQYPRITAPCHFALEQRELSALGVHGTAQVGRSLFTELLLYDLGVLGGAGHGDFLLGG